MKKPLIGLTPGHNLETDDISMRPTYMRAIEAAGGIPVILPLETSPADLQQLTEVFDGFLFTGGPDIHPFNFGEETLVGCGQISAPRDSMELSLLSSVIKARKPILGICRGIQLINVGLGGTIFQDIRSQFRTDVPIAHKQLPPYKNPSHYVHIMEGTLLFHIAETCRIQVNSMHHQAVRDLAPGLIICGTSSDGVIEAIEKPDYPFLLAVQWHPEYLWSKDTSAANIFDSFIKACKQPQLRQEGKV